MIFLDTETVGLVGPLLTVQWARDEGPVSIHHVWLEPVGQTLALLEMLCQEPVCAYNLPFDWFHLQRTHAVFKKQLKHGQPGDRPPVAVHYACWERAAVLDCWCLRPPAALDMLLFLKQGPLQSLMQRDSVRIKRIPSALAPVLAAILDERFQPGWIYFANRPALQREAGDRWQVEPDEDAPEWSDLVLRFGASARLKTVAKFVLNREVIEYPLPDSLKVKQDEWHIHHHEEHNSWLSVLEANVAYWAGDKTAQRYMQDDILLLRDLWHHFGSPPPGDVNSELAVAIACARWRGFRLDLEGTQRLLGERLQLENSAPRAPAKVKAFLASRMSETEQLALTSTEGTVLEEIARWQDEQGYPHPAAVAAHACSMARSAEREANVLGKMLVLGRAHFDFKVIGALSGRTSGAGKWSAHGTPKGEEIRALYLMADENEQLDAGDAESFEVTIAAAAYGDPQLTADLQSGRKIHGIFGEELYELPYEDVMATKLLPESANLYTRAKNTVFARIYGAMAKKISETAGIPIDRAERFEAKIGIRYPGMQRARDRVSLKFCSLSQPGGLGTEVVWRDPADHVESLLGFKRYFTLENQLVHILYELAGEMPPELAHHEEALKKVVRRQRVQTAAGAVRSALYAAAFGIQAANMRAAANHEIQSTGAQITKAWQLALWNEQPIGVHPYRIRTMNVHDEVHAVHDGTVNTQTIVDRTVQEYRKVVPLLGIGWKTRVRSWAEK